MFAPFRGAGRRSIRDAGRHVVWVDHFRGGNARLRTLLEESHVLVYRFVIGELACGTMTDRNRTLALLDALPCATSASDAEVRALVERDRVWGNGIGWIDAHLLASARLERVELFTLDKRLARIVARLTQPE